MERNRRITARIPMHSTGVRTQWSILEPQTGQLRVVEADECFPIAGRLLSGVWQLDDGRVLLATTVENEANLDQRTVRIEYVDRDALAAE
jgi:hypothetical protein